MNKQKTKHKHLYNSTVYTLLFIFVSIEFECTYLIFSTKTSAK